MTGQIDLDQLEALAANATPGPWHWHESVRELLAPWAEVVFGSDDDPKEADAEFIAAADPDTVRALIARVREVEAKLEQVRELTNDPWPIEFGEDQDDEDSVLVSDVLAIIDWEEQSPYGAGCNE